MVESNNIEFSKTLNEYYKSYINIADAKAGAIIAISFIMIDIVLHLEHISNLQAGFYYSTLILLLFSIIFSLLAVLPRLKKLSKGYIYWGNVSQYESEDEYALDVSKLKSNEIEENYSKQNYLVSKILVRKYNNLLASIFMLIASIACEATLYIIIEIQYNG